MKTSKPKPLYIRMSLLEATFYRIFLEDQIERIDKYIGKIAAKDRARVLPANRKEGNGK